MEEGFVPGAAGLALAWLYARGLDVARAYGPAPGSVRVDCPVISIGNLSVGGTGKTPHTVWAAGRLLAHGVRVGVVARPVGGEVPGAPGDEIAVLSELLPGVLVHAARSKKAGAAVVARTLAAGGAGPCAVLVDDGFSHRALARDLDIVLVDAARPLGNGHLLPLGRLREPPTALARADILITTRSERVAPGERAGIRKALARLAPGAELAATSLVVSGVRAEGGLGPVVLPAPGQPVVCLSGLALSGELARSAQASGLEVVLDLNHADHHRFEDDEWRRAEAVATRRGAWLLVSRKDAVRLSAERRLRTHVLEIGIDFLEGGDAVEERLREVAHAGGAA